MSTLSKGLNCNREACSLCKKPACCCQLSAADRESSQGPGGCRDLHAPQHMYSTYTQ